MARPESKGMLLAAALFLSLLGPARPAAAGEVPPPAECRPQRLVRAFGPLVVERRPGKPREETFDFSVPVATGRWTLTVVSGELPLGPFRASSARLSIDGALVVSPDAFNQTVQAVRVPLSLAAGSHRLAIQVESAVGSRLTVLVESLVDDADLLAAGYAAAELPGRRVAAGLVFLDRAFVRAEPDPVTERVDFEVPSTDGFFTLLVDNGLAG